MHATSPLLRVVALAAAIGMAFSVVTPAAIGIAAAGNAGNDSMNGSGNQALSIGVQQGAGTVTVSVSHNGTAVANASVNVTADEDYDGAGDYTTDDAGTVSLETPDGNTTVNVTIEAEKDDLTGQTTVTLRGNEGKGAPFVPLGQRIAAFVHGLQQSNGVIALGPFVADYVYALAPPQGPATTGPPPWLSDAGGPPGANDPGPPAHAGPHTSDDDGDRGPPDHAGPSVEENSDPGNESGPPPHAGPPESDNDDSNATSDDEDDEHGGPPDNPGR